MGWFEEYQTNECVENLQVVIEKLRGKDKQIEYLQKENNRLKDEHYKDEELKRLQEKIDKIREEHKKKCPHCGFDYLFIPTSIVTFGYVRCGVCGEEIKFAEW